MRPLIIGCCTVLVLVSTFVIWDAKRHPPTLQKALQLETQGKLQAVLMFQLEDCETGLLLGPTLQKAYRRGRIDVLGVFLGTHGEYHEARYMIERNEYLRHVVVADQNVTETIVRLGFANTPIVFLFNENSKLLFAGSPMLLPDTEYLNAQAVN